MSVWFKSVNYFWTELLYHRLESEDTSDKSTLTYCSAVRLTFRWSEYHVAEGAGLAVAEFVGAEQKCSAVATAQKQSKMAALQNAFAKVIVVVVDGKKVTVEVDTTKTDPFFYDPLWEDHAAVVSQVDLEEEGAAE